MKVCLRNSNKKTRFFTILHVSYIKAKKKKKKKKRKKKKKKKKNKKKKKKKKKKKNIIKLTGGIIKRPLSGVISKNFKMNLR